MAERLSVDAGMVSILYNPGFGPLFISRLKSDVEQVVVSHAKYPTVAAAGADVPSDYLADPDGYLTGMVDSGELVIRS